MNTNKSQRGQALILIAFGIVALVGFTALAVDGGRVFSDRRHAQNAADTSALAAALKYIREIENNPGSAKDLAKSEAEARAASNNYTTDADSTVTVEFCDEAADKCQDPVKKELPAGANPAEYIRVTIISNVPMTFGRILGREFVTNRVVAITRVQGTKTTGIFDAGAGMYSIKSGNYNDCFELLGNADLVFHNTGIFVNCSGSDALALGGNYGLTMDANARVVGCSNDKNDVPPPIKGTGQIDCGVDEQTVDKDTFKDVPTTEPTPTCLTPGDHDTINNVLTPGYHPTRDISSDTTLTPGVYCFLSGSNLRFQAGGSINGTGAIKLVLSSDTDLKGSANNFENLEVYTDNSDFQIFGTLHADRFRFFGNGNSTFGVQNGEFISGNAYIYTESGEIDIRAGAHVDITAPPPGDKFGGLLMYMPWDNPNKFRLNGDSDDIWRGTVLMPGAKVTYNGGAGFELHGQVIAETFEINGGAEGDIYFSSDYIFSPPSDPTIEFTK